MLKKYVKKVIISLLLFAIFTINAGANTKYGRLTGVNWFGLETGSFTFHGLWNRDYRSVVQQIADLGFNCIRIPWCNAMFDNAAVGNQINEYGVDAYTGEVGMNLDLEGLSPVEILDKVIDEAAKYDISIILDNHSRTNDGYSAETLWYTAAYSESRWINDWVKLAGRYKNKSNVVGADLNNEPHGNTGNGQKPPATWGYQESGYGDTDWKAAAERCGAAVLNANPNLLIIVEGVEEYKGTGYWWGGNLMGVKDSPITSIPGGALVYSAHEYGSSVFNQTWFSASNFPSNMPAIWDKFFYFIEKENIAPLFFGEFGITGTAAANSSSTDYRWFKAFMDYAGSNCSWTFWSFNPNSGDTGGLLEDDWVSVNMNKYNLLKPYLASGSVPNPTPVPTTPPAVTTAPTTPPTETPVTTQVPGQTGDVNNSDSIDIVDALLIAQYYVGLNPQNFDLSAADTNCDGNIDIVDALLVAQYYVDLITAFC
ncbi:MAG: cellulase family glycosylhydrolase [Spirochaetales bacterium]|nr:cellulase family glycosylhydrolase [Spirochaetales bacterium]